ncbi:MAG: LytTR family transcriptional regulator [Bacteroidia bacterium]|nr:LytTR family transcriptional regulator [Bacteroidia bacterium]
MKPQLIYLAALIYFAALISFEAAQQYYYLSNFNLAGKDEVTLLGLIKIHSIRWFIWSLLAIPLGRYVYRNPAKQLQPRLLLRYGIALFTTLFITLLLISLVDLWIAKQAIEHFSEFLAFFTYQKSALFVNAYLGLFILINLYQSNKLLESKLLELSDLKSDYKSVYDELKSRIKDDTPLIQIKIGNKIKNLLLSEVIWVQADDYCVKIHTANRSYNLRKSMKLLEKELEPKGFIRLHRNAIVNKDEVDSLVYAPDPHAKLKNGQKLPIASGRISKVKEFFKSYQSLPA